MRTIFTETQIGLRMNSLIHIVGPYLAYAASVLLTVIFIAIIPHAGETGTIGTLLGYIAIISCGFLSGWFLYTKVPAKTALFAWVLPAAFLTYSAVSWQMTMAKYDSTWSTYFGTNCGGSECMYQFFLTAPFYTALAYSVGALTARLRRSDSSTPQG